MIANRAALRVLAERSAARTLSVYNAITSNATATFAIGKTLDLVKDATGKAIKEAAVKAMANSRDALATDPLNGDKQPNSWLINHKLLAFEAADAIEASRTMNADDKEQAYAQLRAAPIANKPIQEIPSSSAYPRGNTDRNRGKVQWVGVSRCGGDVEDRIDALNT